MSRRFWLRAAAALVALLVVAYVGLCVVFARQAMTGVRAPIARTPASVGLAFEDIRLPSAVDSVAIAAWFVAAAKRDRAIVIVHGINNNRGAPNSYFVDLAKRYHDRDFNVLLIDTRAHGESGGDHVGLGWLEQRDIAGAVDWLRRQGFASARIGVHGFSYGAGAALLAAAARPEIGAVVADSPFADARDLFDQEIKRRTGLPPLFTPGIALFASAYYGLNLAEIPPEKWVGQIAPRPVLLIHGDADTRIPLGHSQRLRLAARGPNDALWVAPNANHIEAFNVARDEYSARVIDWFERGLN